MSLISTECGGWSLQEPFAGRLSSNSLAGFSTPPGSVVGSHTWYKNLCGRRAWWRINLNSSMYRSHFRKAPWCFFSGVEKPTPLRLLKCTDCCAPSPADEWKLLGESMTVTFVMLFIHPNRDLKTMTHCVEIVSPVCAKTEQWFWGFLLESQCEPHVCLTLVLGAGREGRGAVWHCKVRKLSCGDVKCHQIPHLLAKLLQLWLLNVHRTCSFTERKCRAKITHSFQAVNTFGKKLFFFFYEAKQIKVIEEYYLLIIQWAGLL